jgi:hypothetical protein
VLDVRPPEPVDVRALVRAVVASGRAWVAPASFERQDVVRICATHGQTSEADIEALVSELEAARRAVREAADAAGSARS